MPIELASTFGKADYNVVQALQKLADGVNILEAQLASLQGSTGVAAVRRLEGELQRLSAQVNDLARQVQQLQQAP